MLDIIKAEAESMTDYAPPTTTDLQQLKESLGYTGERMAELAGVAGGQQWRKYTGGASPRPLSLQMLFFMAARLEMSQEELDRILGRMRSVGGDVPNIEAHQRSNG